MRSEGAVAALRAATAADHDRVDALFGGYDLADRESYARFLVAHARAVPAVETALAAFGRLPGGVARAPLLTEDLADLDVAPPSALAFALPDDAAAGWGALYVLEGSRLGGAMLARQVGAGLPGRYLGAGHGPGGWRAVLAGLEAAAEGSAWLERAVAAARATFALYGRAVEASAGKVRRRAGAGDEFPPSRR